MPRVGGADGCRHGWVLVVKELDGSSLSADVSSALRSRPGHRFGAGPTSKSDTGGHLARRSCGRVSWRICSSKEDLLTTFSTRSSPAGRPSGSIAGRRLLCPTTLPATQPGCEWRSLARS